MCRTVNRNTHCVALQICIYILSLSVFFTCECMGTKKKKFRLALPPYYYMKCKHNLTLFDATCKINCSQDEVRQLGSRLRWHRASSFSFFSATPQTCRRHLRTLCRELIPFPNAVDPLPQTVSKLSLCNWTKPRLSANYIYYIYWYINVQIQIQIQM